MATVLFYEKPGCRGNARQKEILLRAGHELEIRDLLSHPWTEQELSAFLADLPVGEWFNRMDPRVKSGEIAPERFSPEAALKLLLADPVLIRRPLMQVGKRREVGFLLAVVDGWIGASPLEPVACGGSEGCPDQKSSDGVVQLGKRRS